MINNNKTCIIIFSIIFFLFLGFGKNVLAKDLYVSTTGNDSVTYENNDINNPWLSVLKAWTDAQTNDIVYYRFGTYVISSTINIASGGHNVNHRNYNNEAVTWSSNFSDTTIEIGEPGITVDGINLSSAASDGDRSFFRLGWNSNGSSPSGFTLRNCVGITSGAGDNTGLVHGRPQGGEYAENTLIENCTFIGPGAEVGTINSTAIIMFKGRNWTIRNNEIYNFNTGLFFNKHPDALENSDGLVQNNYIHNCHAAMRTGSNRTDFINNIFDGNIRMGFNGGASDIDGNVGSDYNLFKNNTIMGDIIMEDDTSGTDNIYPGSFANNFENNIFLEQRDIHGYSTMPHGTEGDYNLLAGGDSVYSLGVFYSLLEWQQNLGGCPGNGNECHSVSGLPIFSGGVSPDTISGFALASNSMGYQAGSNGEDMGANVSLVGVDSFSFDTIAPQPPIGLSVM